MKKETKRVVSIILPVCFLSIFLSGAIVSVTNDIYAFVKPDKEVTVIVPESGSIDEISQILYKNNVLNNPFCFSAYVKSKDKISQIENFSGEITLNSNMSYREILAFFK